LNHSQHWFAIKNIGTGGLLSLAKCNWINKVAILMKLAMEKTEIESEVSLRIARRGWVMWYINVKVYIMSVAAEETPHFLIKRYARLQCLSTQAVEDKDRQSLLKDREPKKLCRRSWNL
jgi:hypothetical protein